MLSSGKRVYVDPRARRPEESGCSPRRLSLRRASGSRGRVGKAAEKVKLHAVEAVTLRTSDKAVCVARDFMAARALDTEVQGPGYGAATFDGGGAANCGSNTP